MVLFSALSTNLGNRSSRFPHSHRHDDDEDELNILKTRPAKRYAFWVQGQNSFADGFHGSNVGGKPNKLGRRNCALSALHLPGYGCFASSKVSSADLHE